MAPLSKDEEESKGIYSVYWRQPDLIVCNRTNQLRPNRVHLIPSTDEKYITTPVKWWFLGAGSPHTADSESFWRVFLTHLRKRESQGEHFHSVTVNCKSFSSLGSNLFLCIRFPEPSLSTIMPKGKKAVGFFSTNMNSIKINKSF